jgi:hypothetical protein
MNNQLWRLDHYLNLLKDFAEYFFNKFIARARNCLKVFRHLCPVIFDDLKFMLNFYATNNSGLIRL